MCTLYHSRNLPRSGMVKKKVYGFPVLAPSDYFLLSDPKRINEIVFKKKRFTLIGWELINRPVMYILYTHSNILEQTQKR